MENNLGLKKGDKVHIQEELLGVSGFLATGTVKRVRTRKPKKINKLTDTQTTLEVSVVDVKWDNEIVSLAGVALEMPSQVLGNILTKIPEEEKEDVIGFVKSEVGVFNESYSNIIEAFNQGLPDKKIIEAYNELSKLNV